MWLGNERKWGTALKYCSWCSYIAETISTCLQKHDICLQYKGIQKMGNRKTSTKGCLIERRMPIIVFVLSCLLIGADTLMSGPIKQQKKNPELLIFPPFIIRLLCSFHGHVTPAVSSNQIISTPPLSLKPFQQITVTKQNTIAIFPNFAVTN